MALANASPTSRASRSDSRIVVRNSLVQLLRYLAIWAANISLVLFLPRYLGDAGLGQLQFALSFVSLFSILIALGTRHYLIKEVARDTSLLVRVMGTALGLRVVMAGVTIVLMAIAAELWGRSGPAQHVIYLAMGWMVLTSFAQLMNAGLHGLERMDWVSFAEVFNKVLVAAAGITLLLQGGDVRTYAAVMVVGALVHFLLNAGYLVRFTPLRIDFHPRRMADLAVQGGPYIVMGFLLLAYMHVDVVMLQAFTNDSVVGWHAASLQIYRSIEFFPMVLGAAMLPTLSRMHGASLAKAAPMARMSVAATAVLMLPIGIGLALTASEVIAFFPYPPEFQNSVPVLVLMALTTPVTAILTVLGMIAIATDLQRRWATGLTVTVALNVVMNIWTIRYAQSWYENGAIGAAFATLLTELLMIVFGVIVLRRVFADARLLRTLAKVMVAVGVMAFVVYDAKLLGFGLWALVATGSITYVAIVAFLRVITRSEIAFIWQSVAKRGRS